MKITEEPIVDYQISYSVATANLISDYKIELTFTDGEKKTIDFEPFLSKSQHPSIRKYLNPDTFKQFKIVHGNLNWNDYDMIFPLSDLRKGEISKK
jgi:hypothetical protein